MLLLSHSLVRLENSRIISTTILVDDHVWCTIESSKKIIRRIVLFSLTKSLEELVSRCQKSLEGSITSLWRLLEEYIIFLLIWSSLEHEILVSMIKSFSKNLWLHYDLTSALLLESHQNDLKKYYSRDLRIWQTRIDRDVCKDRRKTSDWRLLRNFLSVISSSNRLSCLLKFRWYYDLW